MADRYCGNCGNELKPESKFCPKCGTPRPVDRTVNAEPAQTFTPAEILDEDPSLPSSDALPGEDQRAAGAGRVDGPVPETARTPTPPPDEGDARLATERVAPPPRGRSTQVGRTEPSWWAWLAALAVVSAIIVGACLALGLSTEASFWVLVVCGVLAYFGRVHERGRRRPRFRTIPTHSRSVPQWVKIAVATRDSGTCRRCGSNFDLQYDHIVPFSRGGRSDDVNNIQLLCGRCNRRKSNRYVG